jgi:hypothetical protein
MTIPIAYSLGIQAEQGPVILEATTVNVEAIDMLEIPVPKSSGTVIADLQPKAPFAMQMLFMKSDNYTDLFYAGHIEYPAAAGYHVSAASPSTNISSLLTGAKLKIKVDDEETFSEITVDATTLDSGAEIAAAIEGAIQALGGAYAAVTFAYTDVYTCTSGTTGADSKVRINPGSSNDMCTLLKIGTAPL